MNKYITCEDLVEIPEYSEVEISVDGNYIAFVQGTPNWDENLYRNSLWLFEKSTQELKQLDVNGHHPVWMKDSNLAFLKNSQVFIYFTKEREIKQITFEENGINDFKFSNEEKGIYFITSLPILEERKKRNEKYGVFTFYEKEYQQNCLCYFDLETGTSRKIIGNSDYFITSFDIAKNGKNLIYTAQPSPRDLDRNNKEIYLFDLETKSEKKLAIDAMILSHVLFSFDSKKICYTRTYREKSYYEYHKRDVVLEIYNLETNEQIQPIKPEDDFDPSILPISWKECGLLVRWKEKMIYCFGFLHDDGAIDLLSKTGSVSMNPSITSDGKHLAYTMATKDKLFEVYLDDMKITNENKLYKNKVMSKKEIVNWENSEGYKLEGLITLPVDFHEGKKYPLLVVMGGPVDMPSIDKWFPVDPFINKGFIVFEPNKRGYYGYGNEFSKADYKKVGFAYFDDVDSGVGMLIDKGYIDENKIGIMGFSEGAETSVFCSMMSKRYKAVSALAGAYNWHTFYISSSIPYFAKQTLGNTPWDDLEIYEKTAGISYLKNASAPTLLLQKKAEPIEPLIGAIELYRGLRDHNIPCELVVFDGTEHYSGEPGQDLAIMNLNLKWFSHYLLNESLEDLYTID